MNKKLGIIGFGEMGKRHAREFREATCGKIDIAGVVEPNDAKYQAGCEWNQTIFPRFRSVDELLKETSPDGIAIASPNYTHLEILRCFDGLELPLFLEKPLDTDLDKVAEIVRWAERYQGPILVDHVMRFSPIIRRAKSLIDAGKLGTVCSFQFTQRLECGPMRNFRRTRKGGGTLIVEKATHDFDVMLFLTQSTPEKVLMISRQNNCGGKKGNSLHCHECVEILSCPNAVTGIIQNNGLNDVNVSNDLCVNAEEVDVPDNEAALITLRNGVFGTYSHSFFCKMPGYSRTYEITGTSGCMMIHLSTYPEGRGRIEVFPRRNEGETETYSFDYAGHIHYYGGPFAARHFLELMENKHAEPLATVKQAFVAEVLGFAAILSAERQEFTFVAETVPDDLKHLFSKVYTA